MSRFHGFRTAVRADMHAVRDSCVINGNILRKLLDTPRKHRPVYIQSYATYVYPYATFFHLLIVM